MDPVKEKLNILKKLANDKKVEKEKTLLNMKINDSNDGTELELMSNLENSVKNNTNENIVIDKKSKINIKKELKNINNIDDNQFPVKQPYKNFTIVQYPDPNNSKYINKLKELYNKEWRSSTDSISNLSKFKNNDNKYIKKLVNNYQTTTKVPAISDSFENIKINDVLDKFIKNPNFDLKEKVIEKIDKQRENVLDFESEKSNSLSVEKKIKEFKAQEGNSIENKSDKNENKIQYQRPKYQKSKTIDLSNFLTLGDVEDKDLKNDFNLNHNNNSDLKEIDIMKECSSPIESDTKSSIDSFKIHSDSQTCFSTMKPFITKSILKIPSTVIEKSSNTINEVIKNEKQLLNFENNKAININENKNRNRFKKKVTVRSHSAEIINFKNSLNKYDNHETISERPNLKRQDAVITKSYEENIHYLHKKQEKNQQKLLYSGEKQKIPKIILKNNFLSSSSNCVTSDSSSTTSLSNSFSSSSSTSFSQNKNCEKCYLDRKKYWKNSNKKEYCKKCNKKKHFSNYNSHKKNHHHHKCNNHSKSNKQIDGKDSFANMINSIKTSLNDFNEFYKSNNQILNNKQTYYSSNDSICGIPKFLPKLCKSSKSYHKSMDDMTYNNYNQKQHEKDLINDLSLIVPNTYNYNDKSLKKSLLKNENLHKSHSFLWANNNLLTNKNLDNNNKKLNFDLSPSVLRYNNTYSLPHEKTNQNIDNKLKEITKQSQFLSTSKKTSEDISTSTASSNLKHNNEVNNNQSVQFVKDLNADNYAILSAYWHQNKKRQDKDLIKSKTIEDPLDDSIKHNNYNYISSPKSQVINKSLKIRLNEEMPQSASIIEKLKKFENTDKREKNHSEEKISLKEIELMKYKMVENESELSQKIKSNNEYLDEILTNQVNNQIAEKNIQDYVFDKKIQNKKFEFSQKLNTSINSIFNDNLTYNKIKSDSENRSISNEDSDKNKSSLNTFIKEDFSIQHNIQPSINNKSSSPFSSSLVSNRTAIFEEKIKTEKFKGPKASNDSPNSLLRTKSLNTPISTIQKYKTNEDSQSHEKEIGNILNSTALKENPILENTNNDENNDNNNLSLINKTILDGTNLIKFQTQPIMSNKYTENKDDLQNAEIVSKNFEYNEVNDINKRNLSTDNHTDGKNYNAKIVTMEPQSRVEDSFVHREIKKYKTKGKTEPILNEIENENFNNIDKTSQNDERNLETVEIKISINERLAALKKNEDWKNRKNSDDVNNELSTHYNELQPKNILSKINDLQLDAESWRKRVPENDAKQFTIASKLDSKLKNNLNENIHTYLSPNNFLTSQIKKKFFLNNQKLEQSVEKTEDELSCKHDKMSPFFRRIILNQKPEIISNIDEIRSNDVLIESIKLKQHEKAFKCSSGSENELKEEKKLMTRSERIELFSTDSELDSFFKENENVIKKLGYDSSRELIIKSEDISNDDDNDLDFDKMVTEAQRLTHGIRAKQTRKTKPKGNHLKNLPNRIEIKNEYEQVGSTNNRNENINKIKKNSECGFTETALAGLASKEDFSNIKLKRCNSSYNTEYPPFNDLMLIQIKGRRFCQARLVEPKSKSLNSGDCFILIAKEKMYLWIGEFANIIEKSKANDIFEWIKYKKELGLKSNFKCSIIEEKNLVSLHYHNFWLLLGGFQNYQKVVSIDEDEAYELLINETNMVYRVINNNGYDLLSNKSYVLEPVKEYWGSILSYNILDESEVFVFDFGSEIYIWNGRTANVEKKSYGVNLAKQLFESGFDYTNCAITPFNYSNNSAINKEHFINDKRPYWSLFGRISQNVETILFKAKFQDWPSESTTPSLKKLSYSKSNEFNYISKSKNKNNIIENAIQELKFNSIKPHILLNKTIYEENPVNLNLEGTNIGRGRHWYDPIERRGYNIITDNVQMWKISNNELIEFDKSEFGEFYQNENYIILWKYKLMPTGFKTLKGGLSQYQLTTGRDRQALFFWHGRNAKQKEKGASTLLTMSLGEKVHSLPHVLIFEEKEIAVFCQLFDGSMIVFQDKALNINKQRMFIIRAENEEENHLVEVKLSLENLRSKTSIIIVNENEIIIWNGCYSSELYRNNARKCVNKLISNHSITFNFHNVIIQEIEEGFENESFINIFKSLSQDVKILRNEYYFSLLKMNNKEPVIDTNDTPRLFHMFTLYGKFESKEVMNPLRSDKICAYPFYQSYLYEEQQPALFLFDNNNEIYIWQGWFDYKNNDESSNEINSSISNKIRFNDCRKCALETAIDYWNAKYSNSKPIKGYVVYAGIEPIEFTNLFPYWNVNEIVRSLNLSDGKYLNQKDDIETVLKQLKCSNYPLEVLRQKPLPDGVDPTRLEYYLSDDEFKKALNFSKIEFYNMPHWRQNKLKKEASLY